MNEIGFAKKTALKAGAMLARRFGRDNEARLKGDNDIVTKADYASQDVIFKAIRKAYPKDTYIGEEDFEGRIPQAKRLWVVDPLDATVNFEVGIPFYCVSIALVDASASNYRPIAGAVYNPEAKELFWAEDGKGAFLNGLTIKVTQKPLGECIVGFTESKDRNKMELANKAISKLHGKVRRFRSFGSIPLESCQVAAGRMAAYFNPGGKPWDSAAANLIVSEAGGACCDINGDKWGLKSNSIITANGRGTLKIILDSLK